MFDFSKYNYKLDKDRIAQHPLKKRDHSKLLIAHSQSRKVEHSYFHLLPNHLLEDTILVRNNSRVIPSRVTVKKKTGGLVEIFLLQPCFFNYSEHVLQSHTVSRWQVLLGGKKIRVGDIFVINDEFKVTILKKNNQEGEVELSWNSQKTLLEMLDSSGSIPLPPYIKRDTTEKDAVSYQTIYASNHGAVAAPTAGLHFTKDILEKIKVLGIEIVDITLHVGLGTFQKMTVDSIEQHQMHSERCSVTKAALQNLIDGVEKRKKIVAVGTTSMRTLESLFWLGVEAFYNNRLDTHFFQWQEREISKKRNRLPSVLESFSAIVALIKKEYFFSTSLMIAPSYTFQVCEGLITNFHQPRSTLLVLVAEFLGNDFWKEVYRAATLRNYRFLSYGDASLLLKG